MYRKILVTLDTMAGDKTLLAHVAQLATLCKSSLLLLHVADGWAARNFDSLKLAESEEMQADRAYLESAADTLRAKGIEVQTHLACGEPPREILKTAEREGCDLIAMTTHGHRFVKDIVLGSTIDPVRHRARVPLLIVRGE